MKNVFAFVILLSVVSGYSQSWSFKISLGALHSSSDINSLQVANPGDQFSVKGDPANTYPWSGRGSSLLAGNFFYFSVIHDFSRRHGLELGMQYLQTSIRSTVTTEINGIKDVHSSGQGFYNNAIRLNYRYSLWSKGETRRLALAAGVLSVLPSSGPPVYKGETPSPGHTHIKQVVGVTRPGGAAPFLNLGVSGGIKLVKVLELGIDLAAYVGNRSLYIQHSKDRTANTQFTYSVQMKKHFFTAGLYLQYKFSN